MKSFHRHSVIAFSLVEVVLALGILSFALVAVVGLLTTTLQTSQASRKDMQLAMMVTATLDEVKRGKTFKALVGTPSKNLYFDSDGTLVTNVSASAPPNAFYRSTVELTPDSIKGSQATEGAPEAPKQVNLLMLKCSYMWPAQVVPAPHTNIFYATLPSY